MQWLALLAIAIVLPTVALLWFMSRVIANERLVVQQKLAVLYQDKLADATARTESIYSARLTALEEARPALNPYGLFRHLVLDDQASGLVVWTDKGSLVYPRSAMSFGVTPEANGPLAEAWQLEFAQRNYAAAVQAYAELMNHNEPAVALPATLGRTRCLSREGQLADAIQACQSAAFVTLPGDAEPGLRMTVENARLLLLSLLKQSGLSPANEALFQKTLDALLDDLYHTGGERALLPASQNLFVARKVLEAMQGPFAFKDTSVRTTLEKLVAAEELSVAAGEHLRAFGGAANAIAKTSIGDKSLFTLRHTSASCIVVVLCSERGLTSLLAGYTETFKNTEAAFRILDASGQLVVGTAQPEGKPFTVAALPSAFPGWQAELYFRGGDIFEKAARRQIAVYSWTGFLVIVLIFIAGGFATRAIGRQIRLNEMKNDFIATVTHELKTPLASMRVLVDTLLEGNVKDSAQANHYLHLVAKENERLSRMIDNFLTFSRMERNKIAFALTDTRPEAVVRDALEAVQTKFAAQHCHVTTDIPKELPVIQADHDAIVTVLVNLLDNACKYTGENKRIALKVAADTDAVLFSVADNGIGLARRHVRRIFDRFYQVDSSLARKSEGCGLGLSIVKFIVDAHHGRMTVESKPGEGSVFTVRLPIGRGNGD